MDKFRCPQCGIIDFGGHICSFKEMSDAEYIEHSFYELEQLASKLEEEAKRNQECSNDGFVYSNTEFKRMYCNDLQSSSSLERSINLSETKELVQSGPFTSSFNTQPTLHSTANSDGINPFDYNISSERSTFNTSEKNFTNYLNCPAYFDPVDSSQIDLTQNLEMESHQFDHFYKGNKDKCFNLKKVNRELGETVLSESNFSKFNIKESGSMEVAGELKESYLDAMGASEFKNFQGASSEFSIRCKELDKYNIERPKNMGRKQFQSSSAKTSQIEDYEGNEMRNDDEPPVSVTQTDAFSEAGPSGINIESRKLKKEKTFVCDKCNKTFSRRGYLNRHCRTHMGEKLFLCHICGKMFSQKYNLNNHILTHTGKKNFMCDICHKGFTTKQYLLIHTLNHSRK